MKAYDTGLRTSITAAIVVAIVVIAGLYAATVLLPNGPTITTPTTTNPTTTTPSGGYGVKAADYLNSRRDDIVFYWMSNSTFVNERLTNYYQDSEPDAFVDGVTMYKNSDGGNIEVLFAPYSENIVGTGSISNDKWNELSGALVNDAIALMLDTTNPPDEFPQSWPIDWYIDIFFDDNTFFYIGYTASDQMVYLQNGTWSGEMTEWGHPDITGFAESGYWLNANNLLDIPMNLFYNAITENVDYP